MFSYLWMLMIKDYPFIHLIILNSYLILYLMEKVRNKFGIMFQKY